VIVAFLGLRSSSRQIQAASEPQATAIPSDLIAAIRNGDAGAIAKLLDSGTVVDARDAEGNTPLILASLYAGPDCVELLLKRGADPNAANKEGATALIRAATNFEKSRLLVAAGANVHVRTRLGNTPLILAARRSGNLQTVKLLFSHGANAKESNTLGVAPILVAAASGDLEAVKLLLDQGADANAFPEVKDPNQGLALGIRTPLMWAAYRNDLPMMRLLFERGADPNKMNAFGTPLTHAAWHDSFDAAELLLARGARVDLRDPIAGFASLHWAAASESSGPELVKLLLAKGADPNAVGGERVGAFGFVPQTARLIAERRGHTAIVDALVVAGAQAPPPCEKIRVPVRAVPERLENSLVIASAEKALAALQKSASISRESFLRQTLHQDCTSCHQQYLPMAAVGHARDRSVRFDRHAADDQIDLQINLQGMSFHTEYLLEAVFHPEPAYTFGYESFGVAAEKVAPCPATDARVHRLVTIQEADGHWPINLPRPPIQSGDVAATALAIHAIKHYGWPGRRAEFDTSIDRGRRWLWRARPESNQEAVFQLLGLCWAGEPPQKLAGLAASLIKNQRKDGGWAQLPKLESDAFATGEALYCLAETVKHPVTDRVWQGGLRFLLERQEEDGTWHVARRAFPFQPTMKSGFPHNRDSWLSAAATSWAVLALTEVLPVGSASGRPTIAQQASPATRPTSVKSVDFAHEVKPLFERSCVACHSGEKPRGLLRVDAREALLKGGESGLAAIVPGHSEQSQLVDYVSDRVPDSEMPPKVKRDRFPALSKEEVALVRAWIDQGAQWPNGAQLAAPKTEGPKP
jgi:ankyrin repeat protein